MKTNPAKQKQKNKVIDEYFSLLNLAIRRITSIVGKYQLH